MISPDERSTQKVCLSCGKQFTAGELLCPDDGTLLRPQVESLRPGDTFADRYEILGLIGDGGWGKVYKARHKLMKRNVAIKMLLPHLVSSPQALKRFQHEAQAASALNHPNILTVHDFGISEEGLPFLVMDYLEGTSLSALLQDQGRLPPSRAIPIFIQACLAMAHAHQKGVIHRDIKPANIMLIDFEGQPDFLKLVDFGIAKIVLPEHTEAAGTEPLTNTGDLFGSPMYMSPEQCRGRELDARSDIYSLGCVIYRTVTGKPAFTGRDPMECMFKQVHDAPAPFAGCCPELGLPDMLEELVMKAVSKDPADRFQNMLEFKDALDALRRLASIELPEPVRLFSTPPGSASEVPADSTTDVLPKPAAESSTPSPPSEETAGADSPETTASGVPPAIKAALAKASPVEGRTTPPHGAEADVPSGREDAAQSANRLETASMVTSPESPSTPGSSAGKTCSQGSSDEEAKPADTPGASLAEPEPAKPGLVTVSSQEPLESVLSEPVTVQPRSVSTEPDSPAPSEPLDRGDIDSDRTTSASPSSDSTTGETGADLSEPITRDAGTATPDQPASQRSRPTPAGPPSGAHLSETAASPSPPHRPGETPPTPLPPPPRQSLPAPPLTSPARPGETFAPKPLSFPFAPWMAALAIAGALGVGWFAAVQHRSEGTDGLTGTPTPPSSESTDSPSVKAARDAVAQASRAIEADDYRQAQTILEQALSKAGDDTAQVAIIGPHLGQIYLDREQYESARSCLERVIPLERARFGDRSVEVAKSQTGLALAKLVLEGPDAAKPLLEDSLSILASGKPHPDALPDTLYGLARVSIAEGNYDDAIQKLQQAVSIKEQAFGKDTADSARFMDNLGEAYQIKGDLKQAEQLFSKALAIEKKQLGSKDLITAGTMKHLATLYFQKNNVSRSEQLFKQALTVNNELLGSDSLPSAEIMSALAMIYERQNKLPQALKLMKQALDIRTAALGPNAPLVLRSRDRYNEIQATAQKHGSRAK